MAASNRSASALVVAGSVAAPVAACGPPATFHSASELAKAIGCEHFVAGPPSDDDTHAEKGSCDINGVPVALFTFATDGRRDTFRRVSAESTAYIAGSSYWVALAPELRATAGDKVRSPIRGTGCC